MADNKDKKIAELTKQLRGLSESENVQIAGLTKQVEDLTKQIADLEAANASLDEATVELKGQIAELKKGPKAANIKGFILEADDPFAKGAMNNYIKNPNARSKQKPSLPFVLPYAEKAGKAALQNYIVRASGGCDVKRAAAAQVELIKFK